MGEKRWFLVKLEEEKVVVCSDIFITVEDAMKAWSDNPGTTVCETI